MPLVLQGFTKSDIATGKSVTTMVIKRKGTTQQITVKGWSAYMHKIVYGATATEMKA